MTFGFLAFVLKYSSDERWLQIVILSRPGLVQLFRETVC